MLDGGTVATGSFLLTSNRKELLLIFDAQLLISKGTGNDYTIYSPWMPRQGDRIRVTLDRLESLVDSGNLTLTVTVLTKSMEATTNGAAATGSAISSTGDGVSATSYSGLSELVRYAFTISSTTAGDWVLFRMLDPVWSDAAKPES